VGQALLFYADSSNTVFDFELDKKLSEIFELKKLNSLELRFDKSNCAVNDDNSDIMECYQRVAEVFGIEVDFSGKVIEKSKKSVFVDRALFEVVSIVKKSAKAEENFLSGRVKFDLLNSSSIDEGLVVDNTKNRIFNNLGLN